MTATLAKKLNVCPICGFVPLEVIGCNVFLRNTTLSATGDFKITPANVTNTEQVSVTCKRCSYTGGLHGALPEDDAFDELDEFDEFADD